MKITQVFKSSIVAMAIAGALLMVPATANAAVFVSVGIAPPVIPVYAQPLAPGYGYIWTPGYWAWDGNEYYWVDGAWVEPPYIGALWTPGYWGWGVDAYFWHPGYWGRTIGYYGGINYGFGYFGTGFWGGYWNGGRFFYNGEYNHLGFRDHDHDGFIYHQRVNGFDGHPGGASFARNEGDRGGNFNRGAGVNGNGFANRSGNSFAENRGVAQTGYRNGLATNGARPQFNPGEARGFNGSGNNFAQPRGNVAQPPTRSFSGAGNFSAQPRANTAAPQARSFSSGGGAARPSFSGGGGFHGGGGGSGGHAAGGRR